MKRALLKAEIKNKLFILPKVLLMIGILTGTFFLLFFGFKELNYSEPLKEKVRVGIVFNPKTEYGNFFIEILNNMESAKDTLDLVSLPSEHQAYEQMESDELDIIVIAPETLVEDIMVGKNTPAKIVYRDGGGIEDAFISEFEKAGTMILNSSQSSVYIAYELLNEVDSTAEEEINRKLNLRYINMALNRDDTFQKMELKTLDDIPLAKRYIASGVLIALLLLGTVFNSYYGERDIKRWHSYRLEGIGGLWNTIISVLSNSIIYLIVIVIGIIIAKLLGVNFPLSAFGIVTMVLMVFCISIIVHISFLIAGNIGGSIFLFAYTLISSFLSGGILPRELLFNIGIINKLNPTYYLLRGVESVILGRVDWSLTFVLFVLLLALTIVSSIIYKRGEA